MHTKFDKNMESGHLEHRKNGKLALRWFFRVMKTGGGWNSSVSSPMTSFGTRVLNILDSATRIG